MAELILASASSRRKELLAQIGVPFQSAAMDIDESVRLNELPNDYVMRLAREKARACLEHNPDSVVLAADTTVVVEGEILGKPENSEHAQRMLRQLSGKNHQVLTGIAVAKRIKDEITIASRVVVTDVSFAAISNQQIAQYIKTGEPMDKAGAYAIQGKAALFVERIEGSYSNVVGLPLAETGKLLQDFGIPLWHE